MISETEDDRPLRFRQSGEGKDIPSPFTLSVGTYTVGKNRREAFGS